MGKLLFCQKIKKIVHLLFSKKLFLWAEGKVLNQTYFMCTLCIQCDINSRSQFRFRRRMYDVLLNMCGNTDNHTENMVHAKTN